MPNDNKMYKFGVGVDKKSLERIKSDLEQTIKPFEDAMGNLKSQGLNSGTKSQVKAELTSLFKLTEKQANALQDMVNGVIPSDDAGIKNLKKNVQDLTVFLTDAMQRLSEYGGADTWVKNGASFIDSFTHMKSVLEKTEPIVDGLRSSVGLLTAEFTDFKDALARINPDAFGKRFAAEVRATTDEIQRARTLVAKLKQEEHKGLQGSFKFKKDDGIFDYGDYDVDAIKTTHAEIESEISHHLGVIDRITSQYASKNMSPFGNKEYRDAVHGLFVELENFNNLKNAKWFADAFPKIDTDDVVNTSGITAEITAVADEISKKLKDAIKEVGDVELHVVLPDASSTEFTSQINTFVEQASKQFKNKPIELGVNLANPFKGKKDLSDFQKGQSNEIAEKYKEYAEKSGIEVNNEDLEGMYSPDTNKISRKILDAFNNIYKIITAGQKNITAATDAWRDDMAEKLVIKPKFDTSKAKQELNSTMEELQNFLDGQELDIYTDTDALVEDIEKALKEKQFVVDIKAKNIDGSGATLNVDNVKFESGTGYQQVNNGLPVSQTAPKAPPKPSTATADKQTAAVAENSNAISDGTLAKKVLTDAINNLQSSIDANKIRNETLAHSNKGLTGEQVLANYDGQIAEISKRGREIGKRKEEIEKLISETSDSSVIESLSAEFKNLNDEWKVLYERHLKLESERKNIEDKIKSGEYGKEAASSKKKRDSEDSQNEKRINAIKDILESEKKPIELIINELTKFWDTANKKINKAIEEGDHAAVNRWSTNAAEMMAKGLGVDNGLVAQWSATEKRKSDISIRKNQIDKLLKNTTDSGVIATLNTELEGLESELQTLQATSKKIQKEIIDAGGAYKLPDVQEIEKILIGNSSLASRLSENSILKSLAPIRELIYFIPEVQKALGVMPKTEKEYIDEQSLQARFKEILKIDKYIETARNVLSRGDIDIDPQSLQAFIDYFGHIPEMSNAVDAARQYLSKIKEIPEELWKAEEPKTYAAQIQEIWNAMDEGTKKVFVSAAKMIDITNPEKSTEIDWAKEYRTVLDEYNKDDSELRDLQTDHPQLQQIIAILQRSSLLAATKKASKEYGEHGLIPTLFDLQKKQLVGNNTRSKDPIHVTTTTTRGREKIYELNAGGSRQAADKYVNYSNKSLSKLFEKTGIEGEIDQVLSAIFDPIVVAKDALESKIKRLNSDIATLSGFDASTMKDEGKRRKKLRQLSYSVFDGTELEDSWHKQKQLQNWVGQIDNVLKSNLNVEQFPDILWNNIKGLKKQKRLEREISDIQNGKYSEDIEKQLKGLTEKEKKQKVRKILDEKQGELSKLKTENTAAVRQALVDTTKKLTDLEDQHVNKIQEVIAAKKQELIASEQELTQIRSKASEKEKVAQDLLDGLFASGKLKITSGKNADTPEWNQEYKYDKTKLAEYERNQTKRKELETEIANLEAGKYDVVTSKALEGLSDEDQKTRLAEIIKSKKQTLERMQQAELTQQEIIRSILVLQDDASRAGAKAAHARKESRQRSRKSERVLDESTFDYKNAVSKQKDAITNKDYYLSNLLSNIDFADKNGLMDTSALKDVAEKYRKALAKAKSKPSRDSVTTNAERAEIDKAWDDFNDARELLLDTYFGTKGWNLTRVLQDKFSVIEGELARKEQDIQAKASDPQSAVDAQMSEIAANEERAKQAADRYAEKLYQKYIVEPQQAVNKALAAKEGEIEKIKLDATRRKDELTQRAQSSNVLSGEIARINTDRAKDNRLLSIQANKDRLRGVQSAISLLTTGEIVDIRKRYGEDKEVNKLKERLEQLKKEGKGKTQEYSDVRDELAKVSAPYISEINSVINKHIANETNAEAKEALEYIRREVGGHKPNSNTFEISYLQQEERKLLEKLDGSDSTIAEINANYDRRINAIKAMMESDKEIQQKLEAIDEKYAQDPEKLALEELKSTLLGQGKIGTEEFKSVESKLKDINTKYQQEKNTVIQQWIAQQSEEIDRVANQAIEQIQAKVVEDSTKDARKAFREETGSNVRSQSGMERVISEIKETAYKEAEAAALEAIAKIDKSAVISPEQIAKELQEEREKADIKKAEALLEIRDKTDAELLSDTNITASEHNAKMAENYDKEKREKEKQIKEKMELYHITDDMLAEERRLTSLEQERAEEARSAQSAVEETTSSMQSGGRPSGGYGAGYVAIDTSHLAQECTLRGIYELLNGGAPKGGWGAYDDQSIQKKSNVVDDDFSDGVSSSMSTLTSSIKDMVIDCKNYSVEVGYLVDRFGKVGETIKGEAHRVPRDAFMSEVNKHVDKNILASLHSHPGKTSKHLSPGDIYSSYNRAYFDENKIPISGSINEGIISAIDWREIDVDVANQIVQRYRSLMNDWQSTLPEIFTYNEGTKKYDADGDKIMANAELQENISKKYNEILQQTLKEFGYADRYMQFDDAEKFASHILGEASSKVTNAVIEAGAQAAVEQSKLVTLPNGDFNETTAKDLSKEINAIKGKQDGGSKLAGALNNLHYLGFTSKDGYTFKSEDSEKLAKAYGQLKDGMQGTIVKQLDDGVQAYIIMLQNQLESIAEANGLDYVAINKAVESRKANSAFSEADYNKAKSALEELNNKDVVGADRALNGLNRVRTQTASGKDKLSGDSLKSLGTGYYKLVETINHKIFEDLDEDVQEILISARDEALRILTNSGVKKIYGSEDLQGKVITEETKDLIASGRGVKKVGKIFSSMTAPAIVQTVTGKDGKEYDNIIQKAQGQISAEKEITAEKKSQKKLTTEAAQQEAKSNEQTQKKAQAEKKVTENKNQQNASASHTSDGIKVVQGGNNGSGSIHTIAQEPTLQKILALLSKGVKTTSGGKSGGASDGNDDNEVNSKEEAAKLFDAYIKDPNNKINALPYDLTNVEQKGGKYKFTVSQYKDLQAIEETKAAIEACEEGTKEWFEKTAQLTALQKEQEKITLSINAKTGEITTSTSFQNIAIGAKSAIKELENVDELLLRIHDSGALSFDDNGAPTSSNQSINSYLTSLTELRAAYQDGVDNNTLFSPETQQRLSQLTLLTQNYRKEVIALLSASAQYNSGDTSLGLIGDVDLNNYSAVKQSMADIVAQNEECQTSFGELTPVIKNGQVVSYQLAYTLRTGKREVQEMTASLNPLTGELRTQKGAVQEVATGWDKFMNELKGKYRAIVQYLASITSIHDFIRYIRTGVQSVREIDSALTELKKVTDETDASYQKFLQDMSKTGAVIGATVSDLTTMAAEWSKLGYSMKDAATLAESTAILLNVSEFQDATAASEALISTMQAFGYAADESRYVVDVLNEVGKFIARR